MNAITDRMTSSELHKLAETYNWDDGFDVAKQILHHQACSLATALSLFFDADGYTFLTEKPETGKDEWFAFVNELYYTILDGRYLRNTIAYQIPLSKVQIYKLKKQLTSQEMVFLTDIEVTR